MKRLMAEMPLPIQSKKDPEDGRASLQRLDPAETMIRLGGSSLTLQQRQAIQDEAQGVLSLSELVRLAAQALLYSQEAGIDLKADEDYRHELSGDEISAINIRDLPLPRGKSYEAGDLERLPEWGTAPASSFALADKSEGAKWFPVIDEDEG